MSIKYVIDTDISLIECLAMNQIIAQEQPKFTRDLINTETLWLRKHSSNNTRLAYQQTLREFCAFGGISTADQFRSVTPENVIQFRDYLIDERGFANRTVNHRLAGLSSCYQFLRGEQLIQDNPVEIVERLAVDDTEGETPAMTEKQARLFLDQPDLSTPLGQRDSAILHTLIFTGCRISEPTSMKVKSLFDDQGYLCLRWKKKGGKNIKIAVHQELQLALNRYLQGCGHAHERESALFLSLGRWGDRTGRGLSVPALKKIFYKYRDSAGLGKEFSPHSTRATFATIAISNGAPIESVQDALGHAFISTTQAYNHKVEKLKDSPVFAVRL